jgi:hypothetical protein
MDSIRTNMVTFKQETLMSHGVVTYSKRESLNGSLSPRSWKIHKARPSTKTAFPPNHTACAKRSTQFSAPMTLIPVPGKT